MLDILVVEDEAPIREWVAYTISNISQEFNVVASACNGKEAYELAIKLKPQVIISDIKMPIMDGITLTKEIKSIMPNVEIVLLTNYEEFSYAKQAISCGVYEYLIKSDIRPKELKSLLEDINDKFKKYDDNLYLEIDKIEDKKQTDSYTKSIKKAIEYIDLNYSNPISLSDIAKYVYLSPEYFSRLFKEEVGENFSTYLTIYRIEKAEYLIKNSNMKISEIANDVGYSNPGYFSKSYKKYKGVSPDEERH